MPVTDASPSARRLKKSPSAFRTISEVAEELDVPQHVLRFWETKFPQVRPLKRGGGRRYYRPEDIRLLRRIRELLYRDGYTIKGVQRLLREGAVKATAKAAVGESNGADGSGGQPGTPAAGAGSEGPGVRRSVVEAAVDELVELRDLLRRHKSPDA